MLGQSMIGFYQSNWTGKGWYLKLERDALVGDFGLLALPSSR